MELRPRDDALELALKERPMTSLICRKRCEGTQEIWLSDRSVCRSAPVFSCGVSDMLHACESSRMEGSTVDRAPYWLRHERARGSYSRSRVQLAARATVIVRGSSPIRGRSR